MNPLARDATRAFPKRSQEPPSGLASVLSSFLSPDVAMSFARGAPGNLAMALPLLMDEQAPKYDPNFHTKGPTEIGPMADKRDWKPTDPYNQELGPLAMASVYKIDPFLAIKLEKALKAERAKGMNALKGEKLIRMSTELGQQLDKGIAAPQIPPIRVIPAGFMATALPPGTPRTDLIEDGWHRLNTARTIGYKTPAEFVTNHTPEEMANSFHSAMVGGGGFMDDPSRFYTDATKWGADDNVRIHEMTQDYMRNTPLGEMIREITDNGKLLHDQNYVGAFQLLARHNSPYAPHAAKALEKGGGKDAMIYSMETSNDPVARFLADLTKKKAVEDLPLTMFKNGTMPWELTDMNYGRRTFLDILNGHGGL